MGAYVKTHINTIAKSSIGKARLQGKAQPKGKANVKGKAGGQGQAQHQEPVSSNCYGSKGSTV
jgi:hypothetical protein